MRKIKELAGSVAEKAALALVGVSAFAGTAYAQGGSTGVRAGNGQITSVPILSGNLTDLVSTIIDVILIAAGVLAVVYLIWGGISYVTAGGDAEKASKGRVAITNAIIGVVIIMASLAIYTYVVKKIQ